MKKILLINFLILLLLAAKAQQYHYIPFPDSGAVWSEIYRTAGEIPIYERFAVNGEDTLMNNKTYTKLYLFYDSIFDKTSASCIGGIREDSLKRVFYYGKEIHEFKPSFSNPKFNNGEVLLYDFGLEVGDTLRFFNTVFPDQLALVSAIDTVLIGNTLRKNFKFYPPFMAYWMNWTEGIGNFNGLLFVSGGIANTSLYNHLVCFSQNGSTLFSNNLYDGCFQKTVGIDEFTIQKRVSIFPNPVADGILQFDFGDLHIDYLQIYNTNGTLLKKISTKKLDGFQLSTQIYKPGIYLYLVQSIDGTIYTGKFLIK